MNDEKERIRLNTNFYNASFPGEDKTIKFAKFVLKRNIANRVDAHGRDGARNFYRIVHDELFDHERNGL